MSTIKNNLSTITPATMRRWIQAYVVDVWDEYERAARAAEQAGSPSIVFRAQAAVVGRIAQGIARGEFKPQRSTHPKADR